MPPRKVVIENHTAELDQVLEPWREHLGDRFAGYRNHCYRVFHICLFQHEATPEQRLKLAIVCGYHQLGMYQSDSLDHLKTSHQLLVEYVKKEGLDQWQAELEDMLQHHQKISKIKSTGKHSHRLLTEVFRLAYVADTSMGFVKSYISGPFIATINDTFSGSGYYQYLAKKHLSWLRAYPLQPFPLFRF